MNRDPILKEIHETRAKLLAESDGDLKTLIERLRSRESEEGPRVISEWPQRTVSDARGKSSSKRDKEEA